MKAVLISIQPKWCELIASGEKTVEVRKTKPKLETPFKCYIYCTQGKFADLGVIGNEIYQKRGKVIGEFVCDKIDTYFYDEHIGYPTPQYEGDESFYDCGKGYWITCADLDKTCLTEEELLGYGKAGSLVGWHISDLVIYDKPRELSEFIHTKEHVNKIMNSVAHWECGIDDEVARKITRPPQSWCYVEGGENGN